MRAKQIVAATILIFRNIEVCFTIKYCVSWWRFLVWKSPTKIRKDFLFRGASVREKHTFLPEFFSCRAGVKPFGRAGYAVELPLFILHIVNSTRCSMAKVVRVWRMRNRQITDSCTRFTDCTSTGWFGGCSRVDCSHGKSVYVYERKIYRRKIFLFFLRKSLQIPNLFVPFRPEWSILLHVSDETKHSQSHL